MRNESVKTLVERGEWVACWVCEQMFGRRRITSRYCKTCERGFCEGEHGQRGLCIVCGVAGSLVGDSTNGGQS